MSSEHSETDISTMSESDTQVLMQLMAPDGYYTYLKIPKPASDKDEIDLVLLKKNYRKLSLKHHPDRATGHVETFRALNRAHLVLLHSKLRQQYDLLGIDLEEDHHDDGHDNHKEEQDEDDDHKKRDESNSAAAPDTLVSAFASAALAGVLQAIVRTGMYTHTTQMSLYRYSTQYNEMLTQIVSHFVFSNDGSDSSLVDSVFAADCTGRLVSSVYGMANQTVARIYRLGCVSSTCAWSRTRTHALWKRTSRNDVELYLLDWCV